MTYRLYGIPNCDTVKKARKHLDSKCLVYEFIDFKKTPPAKANVKKWKAFLGDWPVNTRGRTYRTLKDDFLSADTETKFVLINENSSLVKRPILEMGGKVLCLGYDGDLYDSLK
jgi:arsenate reductase